MKLALLAAALGAGLFLQAGQTNVTEVMTALQTGVVLRCSEPLPEFKVSVAAQPSASTSATICACVWNRLSAADRTTGASIKAGAAVATAQSGPFSARLDRAAQACAPSRR